jgi:RecJ-like exonuclease
MFVKCNICNGHGSNNVNYSESGDGWGSSSSQSVKCTYCNCKGKLLSSLMLLNSQLRYWDDTIKFYSDILDGVSPFSVTSEMIKPCSTCKNNYKSSKCNECKGEFYIKMSYREIVAELENKIKIAEFNRNKYEEIILNKEYDNDIYKEFNICCDIPEYSKVLYYTNLNNSLTGTSYGISHGTNINSVSGTYETGQSSGMLNKTDTTISNTSNNGCSYGYTESKGIH